MRARRGESLADYIVRLQQTLREIEAQLETTESPEWQAILEAQLSHLRAELEQLAK